MLDIPKKVKALFKTDGVLKNIRISFPNGEKPDICNDRLVKESVKFDESISSRPEVQFGLCESSQLSFECVDVGNIRGMKISASIEIDCSTIINVYYSTQEHQPVIVKITDGNEEYFIVVTNIEEHDEATHDIETNDGTNMFGDIFVGGQGYYFSFQAQSDDAGSIDFDYYRSATGHDPRGTESDYYDGYPGGGYAKTYVYSTATQKFYPCEMWDWEGSWREYSGYDAPYNTMPLSYVLSTGSQNADWFELIGEILFDDTERVYYSGLNVETQTSPDVPFPFYRVPLGDFIVDECKRDAGMRRRKVVAYSKISSLSNYDWWTTVGWSLLSPHTDKPFVNFNIMNFVAATNQKLFSPYSAVPLSVSWDGHEVYIAFGFNTDTNHYTFAFRAWTYRAKVYDTSGEGYNSDAPWPSTQRLGRLDSIDMYDYSEDLESIRSTAESLGIEQEAIACLLEVIEYCKPFNPVMMYKDSSLYVGDGFNKITDPSWWKGRHINEGEFFLLPPWISVATYMDVLFLDYSVSPMVERDLGRVSFMRNTPLVGGIGISDITVIDDTSLSIKVQPEQFSLSGGSGYDYYSFEKTVLYLDILRLLEGNVELLGCFGRIGRNGYFQLLTLGDIEIDGLFPSHDILPSESLYPTPMQDIGSDVSGLAVIEDSCMISLWYEEYFVAFGRIVCEYKSSEILDDNNNPKAVSYSDSWNDSEEYLTYDLSGNEIIKNGVWTEAEIQNMIIPLKQALQTIKFYPHDMKSVGLPYIEAGDWVLASYRGNRVLGLILSRTLDGIQVLRDKMKSD